MALLLGYWSLGKTFSYVGVYPIFVGEVVLLVWCSQSLAHGRFRFPRTISLYALAALCALVLMQAVWSVVVLGQAWLEVVRGIAPFYYAGYAVLAYSNLRDEPLFAFAKLRFFVNQILPQLWPWVLGIQSLVTMASLLWREEKPTFPGSDVELFLYRPTDAVMALALIVASGVLTRRVRWAYVFWAVALTAIACARSRAAFLSLIVGGLIIGKVSRRVLVVAAVAALGIFCMWIGDIRLDIAYREVSARQYAANLVSLWNDAAAMELDPSTVLNKRFRLNWWESILRKALDEKRLLHGDGWGSNVAVEYGIVSRADAASRRTVLRSPHNFLLGFLARGGWLVFAGFVVFACLVFFEACVSYRKIRSSSSADFCVALRLLIAYLAIALLNGLTDVFLEAPHGAIPFWLVLGAIWAIDEQARSLRPDDCSLPLALQIC